MPSLSGRSGTGTAPTLTEEELAQLGAGAPLPTLEAAPTNYIPGSTYIPPSVAPEPYVAPPPEFTDRSGLTQPTPPPIGRGAQPGVQSFPPPVDDWHNLGAGAAQGERDGPRPTLDWLGGMLGRYSDPIPDPTSVESFASNAPPPVPPPPITSFPDERDQGRVQSFPNMLVDKPSYLTDQEYASWLAQWRGDAGQGGARRTPHGELYSPALDPMYGKGSGGIIPMRPTGGTLAPSDYQSPERGTQTGLSGVIDSARHYAIESYPDQRIPYRRPPDIWPRVQSFPDPRIPTSRDDLFQQMEDARRARRQGLRGIYGSGR